MKILIVKTSSLGDIIHAFPVLQYLRRCYPKAQIDWIVEKPFMELVLAHPDLNRAIPVQTKKWRSSLWKKETRQDIYAFVKEMRKDAYDLVFDLQGNSKSGLLTGLARSKQKVGFGRRSVPEWPNLLFTNRRYNPPIGRNIREDYLFLAQSTLGNFTQETQGVRLTASAEEEKKVESLVYSPQLQGGLKALVCPGSNWSNKQLSKETLKAFLEGLAGKLDGRFVFVWGSLQEKELVEELARSFPQSSVVADRLALPSLQNLMTHMQLVIAMDSLPLHLAGTTATPTYSLFGGSLAHKYKPLGNRHQAYQGSCPYGKTFNKRCPILRTCSTGACIKDIQASSLISHFLNWWQSSARQLGESCS